MTTSGYLHSHPPHHSTNADSLKDSAALIHSETPKFCDIWYGHSLFTSTLFPQTHPRETGTFISKQSGNFEYILEAGIDPTSKIRKFPCGKYPRILMCWIAKRIRMAGKRGDSYVDPETKTIRIPSLSFLATDLGIGKGGTTLQSLNDQIRRLAICRISVHRVSGYRNGSRREMINLPLAHGVVFEEFDDVRRNGFTMAITPEIWEVLVKETAPFDLRAARSLLSGRSVMPYDIYIWLLTSYWNLRFQRDFSWIWLREKFGEGLTDERNFRLKFRKAMTRISAVYPAARFAVTRNGITLFPSAPAIEPKRDSLRSKRR